MGSQIPIHSETLFREIVRYLAAVDAFRAAGYEPTWRPERLPARAPAAKVVASADAAKTRDRRLGPPRFTV